MPITFSSVMGVFAPVFSPPVWPHVKVLITGAVLAPGKRPVTAVLQSMGLSAAADVQTSPRVLNRAVWSPLNASRLRRRLFGAVCIPGGVVLFGRADPIERRRGDQLNATGRYRDPVRSSPAYGVNVSGRRWLAWRVLPPISWAHRVWALPVLTVLCPSARDDAPRGRHHPPLTERAGQMIRLVGRWVPGRAIALVTDSSCAALALRDKVKAWPCARVSTRRRLDAALDAPPPPRQPETNGRPRLTGQRRPTRAAVWADARPSWTTWRVEPWYGAGPREVEGTTDTAVWYHAGKPPGAIRWGLSRDPKQAFAPPAWRSTPLEHTPAQMLPWCVRRWSMAVTCAAARAPLGMETPRQWHDRASARTTPARLSRSALITLTAHLRIAQAATCRRSTAWYRNIRPTCSDAMAVVRRDVWEPRHVAMSQQEADMIQLPRELFERFIDAVCYAA